jgi:hypothetical protein
MRCSRIWLVDSCSFQPGLRKGYQLRIRSIIVGVLSAQILAACTTSQPDDLGVQAGYITRIYGTDETPADYPECLVPLTESERVAGRYATVEFRQHGSNRYVNVFVTERVGLKINGEVLVNSPYCVGSHRPEIIARQS